MNRLRKLTLVSFCRLLLLGMMLLLLAMAGVDLLFQEPEFRRSYEWVVDWVALGSLERTPLLVIGILCLFLPLFYLLMSWLEVTLERGIVGKGKDGGDICLTPEGIEKAVIREVRGEVPEVLRVRSCRALQGRRAPKISIRVSISDRTPAVEVRRQVRETVEKVLTRMIGFSDGSQIRVKVSEIVGARGERPRRGAHARQKRRDRPSKSPSAEKAEVTEVS